MKKTIAITAAFLLSCSALSMTAASAEGDAVKVYVTVSDGTGAVPAVQEEVEVTDIDSDGALTINDALYILHENSFEGGAAAGYGSETASYGLMLTKLWGVENGGSYGYYVNNTMSMGLTDAVKDGDYINAFVYSDAAKYSDTYSWFDQNTAEAEQGEELSLVLSHIAFDENYNPLSIPVENAVITINGEATEYVTDAEGKVTVKLENAGKNIISATSDSLVLVPPVCVATVAGEETETTTTTTTTAEETTTTTTDAVTTAAVTTKAAVTTAAAPSSPSTGDAGVAVLAGVIGAAAITAFAVKRRNED